MKKSRVFTIIPIKVHCVACDSLFYNSNGQQDDLTSLFLDVINVDTSIVEEKLLKFCPQCTYQLKSIETLLSELDIVSAKLQNARDHVVAVVTNTAFRLKYGDNSLDNEHESSKKAKSFVTLREKIIENWISMSQDEKKPVPLSTSIPSESKNKNEQIGGTPRPQQVHNYSVLAQNNNNLETTLTKQLPKLLSVAGYIGKNFSSSDHQYSQYLEQEEEEEDSHDHSLENVTVVVEEVTDVEESNEDDGDDDDTTCHIKIEPGSWRTISDPKDFPGNHHPDPPPSNDDNDSPQEYNNDKQTNLTITRVDSDEEANNSNVINTSEIVTQNSNIFYEESDYYSNQEQGQDEGMYDFMENSMVDQGKNNQIEAAMSSSSSSSHESCRTPDRVPLQSKFLSTPPPPKLIAMTSLKQLQQHHQASIPKLKPSVVASNQKETYIEMCTLCYKFIINGDLISHLCEGKSTTSRYQCGYCNAVFLSEKVLADHVHRHLREQQTTTNSMEMAKTPPKKINISVQTCKICKKKFANPVALSAHFKTDHGANKLFKCEVCPKIFADASKLREHMTAHVGKGNFEHDQDTTVNNKVAKPGRVRSDQIYQCAYCLRAFRLRNDLQRHLLIHTGEKPFPCTKCSRAFNRKHHLETHLEVHQRQELLRQAESQNGQNPRFSVKTRSSGGVKKDQS